MDRTTKRNIIGSIACFLSAVMLAGIAIAYWMIREVYQSKKYHFDVETDDIVRYSIIGAIGSIINTVLLVILI